MMDFSNRISQALHEEHRATIALMERLEQLIVRHRRGSPPSTNDAAVASLLRDLPSAVEAEVERHFAFEEGRLFPYLASVGDDEICAHLIAEHTVMRPIGVRIAGLAREASTGGFSEANWEEFRRSGQELCERMLAHVQKEEMALLPLLEEHMDKETESQLVVEYLESV